MLKDKILIDGTFSNRIKEDYIKKNYPEYYKEILEFSIKNKLEKFEWKRRLYHYIFNIKEIPICICGKEINFRGRPEKIYNEYCSTKCAAYSISDIRMKTLKKNNLNKYGVENVFQTNFVKEKLKETNLKKYGVDNPNKSKIIREKIENTCIEKYGKKSYMETEDFKTKSKETNLEKYGFDFAMKNDFIKNKLKNVFIEKYGTGTISENDEFRKNNFAISKNINYVEYIGNRISKFKCDIGKDHLFEIHKNIYMTRKRHNNPLCTTCYPISENTSIKEKELLRFFYENYKGVISQNYKDGIEIDIYLPELKLGFEFNGLYWHSETFKDKKYHLDKTNYFKEKGIRIVHIWEDDWNNKNEIIKSQIKNLLGLTENKIFARKCKIKKLIETDFLNMNHIQGNVNSIIKIGLYYNDVLVSVMTFDQFEGRKKMEKNEWNLSRFCNKLNTSVIGGASRLFKYFIKTYNPSRIISYADKSWSSGNLYYTLGFELNSQTKPDYKYIINGIRENKTKYKKSKLIKEGFFSGTEKEIMQNLDYKRIYDCGKIKFEINL